MALQIVERPAHRHGPAVAEIGGVHEVGPARENVGLQCHAEAAAIVDHLHMVMRDAARAGVEVEPLVEGAGLELVAELAKAAPRLSVRLRPPARREASRMIQS
jgi:hypothetical protein